MTIEYPCGSSVDESLLVARQLLRGGFDEVAQASLESLGRGSTCAWCQRAGLALDQDYQAVGSHDAVGFAFTCVSLIVGKPELDRAATSRP